MKIISEREVIESVEHHLCFDMSKDGSGYAFPCDEAGNIDEAAMNPDARANLAKCRAGAEGYRTVRVPYVQTHRHSYVSPRIGRCHCGEEVYLDRFTNTCHGCGTDYNSGGQELAPREQWGEETGESLADILAADSDAGDLS